MPDDTKPLAGTEADREMRGEAAEAVRQARDMVAEHDQGRREARRLADEMRARIRRRPGHVGPPG